MAKGKSGGLGGGGTMSLSNKREMQSYIRNAFYTDQKYLAVGVAIVGMLLMAALLYTGSTGPIVKDLDIRDRSVLDAVFQSGDPWVIFCRQEQGLMPPVISATVSTLSKHRVSVGVMDCKESLPSGKTPAERFSLDLSSKHVVFVSANRNRPQQVPLGSLLSEKTFMDYVKSVIEIKWHELSSSEEARAKCFSKQYCLIMLKARPLKKAEQKWLSSVMKAHRDVRFAQLDSRKWRLSIEKGLPDYEAGKHRYVFFKRVTKDKDKIEAKAFRDEHTHQSLDAFLSAAREQDLARVTVPKLIPRRKKVKGSEPRKATEKPPTRKSPSYEERRPKSKDTYKENKEELGSEMNEASGESFMSENIDGHFPEAADENDAAGLEDRDQDAELVELD